MKIGGETMTPKRRISVNWLIWLQWAFASGFGGALGFTLADTILDTFGEALRSAMAELVIFGLLGATMGILQWLVLRKHLSQAGWWVAASAGAGMLIGIGAAYFSNQVEVNVVIGYALVGVILGMLQWLVLRGQISWSALWIIASSLGWTLAVLEVQSLDQLGLMRGLSETLGIILAFGMAGTMVGIVTGGLLVWLLWQSSRRAAIAAV